MKNPLLLAFIALASSFFFSSNHCFGKNLLKNQDFMILKPEQMSPRYWGFDNFDGSDAEFFLDENVFHNKKPSIRIIKRNDKGWTQLYQTVKIQPLTHSCKIKLSTWILSENTKSGSLVVFANAAGKRNIIWKTVKSFQGTFDWKKIEGFVILPKQTDQLTISIRLNKEGLIWVDDCKMELLGEKPDDRRELLLNPSLRGEINPLNSLPSGWRKNHVDGYENVSSIQVKAPEVRIKWQSGGAKFGIAAATIANLQPGHYQFRAECRTSAGSEAQLSAGNEQSETVKSETWKTIAIIFQVKSSEIPQFICWNLGPGTVHYRNFSLKAVVDNANTAFPIQAEVMPVAITKVWKGEEEFYTFPDTPLPLSFLFKGDLRSFKKGALVLDLPAELYIAEAYNTHTNLTQCEIPVTTPVLRHGKKFIRYTYNNPQVFKIMQRDDAWERSLALLILPQKKNPPQKTFTVYWYLTADNRKSPEKSFQLHLLPAMKKTEKPENFFIWNWNQLDINFPTRTLREKVFRGMEKAGMSYRKRNTVPAYKRIDKELQERGWKFFVTEPDYYHIKFFGIANSPFQAKIPRVKSSNGMINKQKICPSYFNTDLEFRKELYGCLEAKSRLCGMKNNDPIVFDIEPWQPMEWCFCKACRKDFSEKFHLGHSLSAQEIITKYPVQWSAFRCCQTADTIKIIADFFRKKYPQSKIYDYDYVVDFRKTDYRSFYRSVAKDPQLNEAHFDGHFASYYHLTDKNACDLIDVNIRNLKKIYHTVAALDRPGYLNRHEVLSPARMRMLLLASVASGARGIAIYPGQYFDGLYMKMFNQTMPLVAELEKQIRHATRIDDKIAAEALPYVRQTIGTGKKIKTIQRPNWKEFFAYRAYKNNEDIILSLFNYNPVQILFVKLSLDLPGGRYTIIQIGTGKRLLPDKTQQYWTKSCLTEIMTETASMDASFLQIRHYRIGDDRLPADFSNSHIDKFQKIKQESSATGILKTVASNQLKIEADDIDENGELDVLLSSAQQKVWINPALSGAISAWKYREIPLLGWNTKIPQDSRLLCADRFWLPKSWRSSSSTKTYIVRKAEIIGDTAILELSKHFPDQQLELRKTYRIYATSDIVSVGYSIQNIGQLPIQFSFWIHNYPTMGNNCNVPSTEVTLALEKGEEKIFNQTISKFYPTSLKQGNDFPFRNLGEIIKSNQICVFCPDRKVGFHVRLSLTSLACIYIWSNLNPTIEWISKTIKLAPGEKWETCFTLTPFTGNPS